MDRTATCPEPEPEPVELVNVVCVRCDRPLYHSPARGTYCPDPQCVGTRPTLTMSVLFNPEVK